MLIRTCRRLVQSVTGKDLEELRQGSWEEGLTLDNDAVVLDITSEQDVVLTWPLFVGPQTREKTFLETKEIFTETTPGGKDSHCTPPGGFAAGSSLLGSKASDVPPQEENKGGSTQETPTQQARETYQDPDSDCDDPFFSKHGSPASDPTRR